jgi:PAS domain S-box-containing protein
MEQLQFKGIASRIHGYKETELRQNDLIYPADVIERPYGMSLKTDLRNHTIQALCDELQCYESLDQSIPVGVVAFDFEWRQTYVNTTFCRMVEWSEKELIGRMPPFDYLPGEHDHDSSTSKLQAIFYGRDPAEAIDVSLRRSNGERFDALLFTSPLTGRFQEKIGWVASVIDNTEQRQMLRSLEQSQEQLRSVASNLLNLRENDKSQVARVIHDSVFQNLIAIKYGIESIQLKHPEVAEMMNDSLSGLLATVHLAIEDAHKLHMELRPSLLDDFGAIAAIDYLFRKVRETYPAVGFNKVVRLQEFEIPQILKTVLYRTIEKALISIVKDGKANAVSVIVQKVKDSIQLVIQDDSTGIDQGKRFTPGSRPLGSDEVSMKEQVELSGGTFFKESFSGKGTRMDVIWPCQR